MTAGFDVFAMDMTGYGKSSGPKIDDPCNVGEAAENADPKNIAGSLQAYL